MQNLSKLKPTFTCRLAMKSWQKISLMTGISKEDKSSETFSNQWMKDAKLLDWGPRSLFPEYLEMGK